MKVIALLSGGKDSVFSILHCIANGHDVVALANLHPGDCSVDELDSMMFQTVGHQVVPLFARCLVNSLHEDQSLAPPLDFYQRTTAGKAEVTSLDYTAGHADDEVEDLYQLLLQAKTSQPELEAVCSGAILSTYQRLRVENVCARLGLQSIAYLWRADQDKLLDSMVRSGMNSILIKAASLGLGKEHLGRPLSNLQDHLRTLNEKYGSSVCGEGGEYETLTLDAPIFRAKIVYHEEERVSSVNNETAMLRIHGARVQERKNVPSYSVIRKQIRSLCLYPMVPQEDNHENTSTELCDAKGSETRVFPEILGNLDENYTSARFFCDDVESKQPMFGICKICPKQAAQNSKIEDDTNDVMCQLKEILRQNDLTFAHVLNVQVLVQNMENFAKFNKIYVSYFKENEGTLPPSRALVQANITKSLQLDCTGCCDIQLKRGLHVPSISYWAPANIGPYSQCTFTFPTSLKQGYYTVAGQIGLVPETMTLLESPEGQARLALKHTVNIISAILWPYDTSLTTESEVTAFESILSCVCYISEKINNKGFYKIVQNTWSKFNKDSEGVPLVVVKVPRLPRDAAVEWVAAGAHANLANKEYETYDDSDSEPESNDKVSNTSDINGPLDFTLDFCKITVETRNLGGEYFAVIAKLAYKTLPKSLDDFNKGVSALRSQVRNVVSRLTQETKGKRLVSINTRVFHVPLLPPELFEQEFCKTYGTEDKVTTIPVNSIDKDDVDIAVQAHYQLM